MPEALGLAVGLAHAVKEWHERGKVHGCVTPASVLCGDGALELTPPRSACPSAYRAPELWMGAPPDFRSDIFSVGVICYEMISGSPPFRGQDDASLRRALLERAAEPLADAPLRLRRTIAACLEKRPERRLQRIGTLLTELRLHEIERRPATAPVTPAIEALAPAITALPARAAATAPDPEEIAPGYLSLIFNPSHRCPRCGAVDVRNSRPRNTLERNMVRVRVKLLRCQRCYSRFVRVGFLRMEIDEAL